VTAACRRLFLVLPATIGYRDERAANEDDQGKYCRSGRI